MAIKNLWSAIRCKLGWQNPPKDEAFTCMGAVFIGGPCTRCSDETARERRFLGNAWDFGGSLSVGEDVIVLTASPANLLKALQERGLSYIGNYPA